jgi:hypothetical protein
MYLVQLCLARASFTQDLSCSFSVPKCVHVLSGASVSFVHSNLRVMPVLWAISEPPNAVFCWIQTCPYPSTLRPLQSTQSQSRERPAITKKPVLYDVRKKSDLSEFSCDNVRQLLFLEMVRNTICICWICSCKI